MPTALNAGKITQVVRTMVIQNEQVAPCRIFTKHALGREPDRPGITPAKNRQSIEASAAEAQISNLASAEIRMTRRLAFFIRQRLR